MLVAGSWNSMLTRVPGSVGKPDTVNVSAVMALALYGMGVPLGLLKSSPIPMPKTSE